MVKTGVYPKIIHGRRMDIWAAGLTLYVLATGFHPFMTDNPYEFKNKITNDEIDYSMFA
jgi:serine/threonine protein kinase